MKTMFFNVLFEISNEDRMQILETLKEEQLRLSELTKSLDSTPQETSRHLNRLSEANLIEKRPDSNYILTNIGRQVLLQVKGLRFLLEHTEYFTTHTTSTLPLEFQNRIGELEGSMIGSRVMDNLFQTEQRIKKAKKSIWIMSDQVLMSTLGSIHDFIENGGEFRVIFPHSLKAPDEYHNHQITQGIAMRRQVKGVPAIHNVIIVTDDSAQITFPRVDGSFDYIGFDASSSGVKWGMDLFNYYWERGSQLNRPS